MIGLISAVEFEAGLITGAPGMKKTKGVRPLAEGSIAGKKTAFICSGLGAANAARAVSILAERKKPGAIVLFGIGGAYPSGGLEKGGLAAAQTELYADCGLIAKGHAPEGAKRGFEALGFPLMQKGGKQYFDSFPLDGRLLDMARMKIPGLATGTFLTVCATGRPAREAARLGERYGAIVENMEGAAAAQTALFYGIPLLEIRGISNITGEPPSKWLKREAAAACQEAVLEILKVL